MKHWPLLRVISLAACSLPLASQAAGTTSATQTTLGTRPLARHIIHFPHTKDVQVTLLRGTIPPGGSTAWHVHVYPQTSYLISGTVNVQNVNGSLIMHMTQGHAAIEPAGVVMRATNPSKTVPAVVLLFQVTPPGKPAVRPWHV